MNNICKGFQMFKIQFKREAIQTRIAVLFIIIAIFIYSYLQPVVLFSKAVNIPITPWAFPHLINDFVCQLVFMSGAIFLFCTAPFRGENYSYLIYRTGKISWQIGNIVYIILLAIIYVAFIKGISIISLLPNISFADEWGKIWGTLAQTDAITQYSIPFMVYHYMIGMFSPLNATLISFFLETACIIWIGLVMYFFNSSCQKPVGTFLGTFFVFLDVVISNSWSPKTFLFSPVTLTQLKSFSGNNVRYGITLNYAVVFYVLTICGLIGICLSIGKIERLKDKVINGE